MRLITYDVTLQDDTKRVVKLLLHIDWSRFLTNKMRREKRVSKRERQTDIEIHFSALLHMALDGQSCHRCYTENWNTD